MPAQADVTLIAKGKLQKIADPAAAVRRALSEPVDSSALAELARGRKSACILICDITRPVPNHLFLRPMIETLIASGVALDRIMILVATGLHRPNLGEELAELVGDPWVHGAGSNREPLCAQRRRSCRSRPHRGTRNADQARPPFHRSGLAHRHRPGRAAFHGRLVGRPQGRRARRRRARNHPHLPLRPLHGGSSRHSVQSGRQSASRRAARDRPRTRRRVCPQHGHRR